VQSAGNPQETRTFEEHFGFPRPAAPAGSSPSTAEQLSRISSEAANAGASAAEGGAASSSGSEAAAPLPQAPGPFVAPDGHLHRPSVTICVHRPSAVTIEDKSLDLRVYFSKEFPITVSRRRHMPVISVDATGF
jgi:hypothetical protein